MSQHPLNSLLKGFQSFRLLRYERKPELFEELLRGQSPKVMIIACCDSRVDPAIILDTDPGELFVVRNVANLVPPCEQGGGYHGTSAALEFAVTGLEVEHIVVFGHAKCGGIRSLMQEAEDSRDESGGFIHAWMNIAAEARRKVLASHPVATLEEQACACEKAAIGVSLQNLMTFPWIRERVEAGKLGLHGWYFDLEAGQLLAIDSASGQFQPVMQ
jgi:carbonic anhydrase